MRGGTHCFAEDTGVVTHTGSVDTNISTSIVNTRVAESKKSVLDELAGCEGECSSISGRDTEFEGIEEGGVGEEGASLGGNEVGEPGVRV